MSTFAERLRAAMSRAGLKSTDVHELTKISKSTISEYLSGSYEPKQKNIYKLSKALGVEPSYLMGLSKVEPSPSPAPEKPVTRYTFRVPVLGRIAAGTPILAQQEIIEIRRKTPSFSYGDISRVRRICVSN